MRCPSCGGELGGTSVIGTDNSWRCPECGGVWAAAWVVNQIADGKRLLVGTENKEKLTGGKNVCPADGETMLSRPVDSPDGVNCWSCQKCGWWWFDGDEIFEFSHAWEIKRGYAKAWGKKQAWPQWVWPAIAVLLLTIGMMAGLTLIKIRQQVGVPAKGIQVR